MRRRSRHLERAQSNGIVVPFLFNNVKHICRQIRNRAQLRLQLIKYVLFNENTRTNWSKMDTKYFKKKFQA